MNELSNKRKPIKFEIILTPFPSKKQRDEAREKIDDIIIEYVIENLEKKFPADENVVLM